MKNQKSSMANVAVDIQYNMPCHSDPARVPCDRVRTRISRTAGKTG